MTSFQKLVLSLIDRGNLKLIFRTLRMNVSYVNYVKKCYSMVRLFERAGLCYNESSQRQWRQIDRERIYDGDYAVREDRKQHRKLKKRSQIKQQDAFQHIEGIQYQPQGFHTNEAR